MVQCGKREVCASGVGLSAKRPSSQHRASRTAGENRTHIFRPWLSHQENKEYKQEINISSEIQWG